MTSIIMKCLDPNELALRKNSKKIVSNILSRMVKIYPMMCFHNETQKIAAGSYDGSIVVYDLRTS